MSQEALPTHAGIITSLRYKIRGRENQFVKVLDEYDLERLSRLNAHTLSKWRELHDAGRGILLHLADIGLTEEVTYPARNRIEMDITLQSFRDASDGTGLQTGETIGKYNTFSYINADDFPKHRFTVCLIRHNQLLKGDIVGTRFTFLNEQ